MVLELVLLIDVQVIVLNKGVFAEITHIDVNLGLVLPHIFVDFLHEEIVALGKAGVVVSDLLLVLLELALHVQDKLLEVLLIVKNQLVDDRFMNIDGREFILRTLDYDSGELGEMLGYLGGAGLEDE